MNKHDAGELRDLQALPLDEKINLTKRRIVDWNDHFRGNVFVSFSGGKDSTVLLDLVRETLCDDSIPAVFANTGLEYAQIQRFVRDTPNAEIVRPSMRFDEVISTYGYPIISKDVAGAIYYARRIRNSDSDDANTSTKFLGTRNNSSKQSFRRMVLLGRFPRSGMTGTTGAGGVFSQPLSQFNQKKWLAASQELPFLIGNKCCDVMKKSRCEVIHEKTKAIRLLRPWRKKADSESSDG